MTRVEHLMGTVFTITLSAGDAGDTSVDAAFEWLRWVEATFSTFREDSEICRIGRGVLSIVEASPEVRHVLTMCEELETTTGRRFSIRPGRPGGPGLDPAAFVKGWSVDEVALQLRLEGAASFIVDAGGDVLCVGVPPGGDRWRVGVRHPETPDEMGAVVRIPEGAVATPGSYFRSEHIRRTEGRSSDVTSVTVVGPRLGIADALATAIYADGAATLSWMAAFPEYGVLLMTADHRLRWTEHLDGMVES